ncbi:hypothetical protein EV714DRAFT_274071 [Schizophyllum commune]
MDFSHFSLAHSSPNIPHGLGNGSAPSNQNSLSDNLAALNTIDASSFWQAQYQHVQAKNNKMEIDMGFIKHAYTDVHAKLEAAITALSTATNTINSTSEKLADSLTKIDKMRLKTSRATNDSEPTTDIPNGIRRKAIVPPTWDPDEFDEKVCWTEDEFKDTEGSALDALVEPDNLSLRFIRTKDGRVVSKTRASQIRELFRHCFHGLVNHGFKVPNFGDAGIDMILYVQHEVYTRFPEVSYCDENWKFKRTWQAAYAPWKQKHPTLALQKNPPVKNERGTSVVATHTPTSMRVSAPASSNSSVPGLTPASLAEVTFQMPNSIARAPAPILDNRDPSRESYAPESPRNMPPRLASAKRRQDSDLDSVASPPKKRRSDELAPRVYKVADILGNVPLIETPTICPPSPPPRLKGPASASTSAADPAQVTAATSAQPAPVVSKVTPSIAPEQGAPGSAKVKASRERVWQPATTINGPNLHAHECRRKDNNMSHSDIKAAWEALKRDGTDGTKTFAKRAKTIKAQFPSFDAYFKHTDAATAAEPKEWTF